MAEISDIGTGHKDIMRTLTLTRFKLYRLIANVTVRESNSIQGFVRYLVYSSSIPHKIRLCQYILHRYKVVIAVHLCILVLRRVRDDILQGKIVIVATGKKSSSATQRSLGFPPQPLTSWRYSAQSQSPPSAEL